MSRSRSVRAGTALLAILALAMAYYLPALAEAPSNDEATAPLEISYLPFVEEFDTSEATASPDDPYPSCNYGPNEATVWFLIVPDETMTINIRTQGSSYTAAVAVYFDEPSWYNEVACSVDADPLTVQVDGGVTYYIQVGALNGGWYPPPGDFGGTLRLEVEQPAGPSNDHFAQATVVSALPFDDTPQNTWAATTEPNEPLPTCVYPEGQKTIWYAFTPTETQSYYVNVSSWSGAFAAVYTGFSNEERIIERCWAGAQGLALEAGQTYYIQIGSMFGYLDWLSVHLDVAPPPVAAFWPWMGDPSVFDDIWFLNDSYDPACPYCGELAAVWDFGDGATSTEWHPSHRYALDGDYTVSLTVTAADGRSASTEQVVNVRTHDVAITRFGTPQVASVGQTRQITVDVNNTRQVELVEVHLYKSTMEGWQWIGSLVMQVPVRPANRTTTFRFSYTFTEQDAAMGRMNFLALAHLVDARDALPLDNEAISLPTKVNP